MERYKYEMHRMYLKGIDDCIGVLSNQIGRVELVVSDSDIFNAVMLLRDLWGNTRQKMLEGDADANGHKNEFMEMLKEDK